MMKKVINLIVDSAFRSLQHDTGPQDQEYVHLHRVLSEDVSRILSAHLAALQAQHAQALAEKDREIWRLTKVLIASQNVQPIKAMP